MNGTKDAIVNLMHNLSAVSEENAAGTEVVISIYAVSIRVNKHDI